MMMMMKRCSQCSSNGHNMRTCPARGGGGVRLFGVCLTEGGEGTMKKSASVGCLSSLRALAGSSAGASPFGPGHRLGHPRNASGGVRVSGYASDEPVHASSSPTRTQRKKGIPWTKEEHQKFLLGLENLGKGDWRGIAKKFVVTKTSTQVASHAQKYFIRQSSGSRRRRRTSMFDMVPETPNEQVPVHQAHTMAQSPPFEPEGTNVMPYLHLGPQQGPEARQSVMFTSTPLTVVPQYQYYHAFVPVPLPFWLPTPSSPAVPDEQVQWGPRQVLKPTPVTPSKEPVNVDEVVGMSNLSIGEGAGTRSIQPSHLTLELLGSSTSRQSAFDVNPSRRVPDLNQSSNSPIHAV